MKKNKKTLILGASPKEWRFAYKAANKLKQHQHDLVLIGREQAIVADVEVLTKAVLLTDIDTVTMYLNPRHQPEYYDYILQLAPSRIIFNPGSENPELATLAQENDIQVIEACTLVMLANDAY